MVNVCAATLVMTRTQSGCGTGVRRAVGRAQRGLGGLARGRRCLSAVLDPRQVYLLAGALGGVVTLWMTVRLAQRLGTGRGHSDISFAAEQSRA